MFEKLIESLLGSWGPAVLSFVYEYQLILSILVVAFGIVMIIRRRKKNNADEDDE